MLNLASIAMKLGKDSPKERRESLAGKLNGLNVDFALVSRPRSVFYFTGFMMEDPTRAPSLIVAKNGESFLHAAVRDEYQAKRVFKGEILPYVHFGLQERMVAYPDFLSQELAGHLSELKETKRWSSGRIGIDEWYSSETCVRAISRTFSNASIVDLSAMILSMRRTKGRDELENLREGVRRLDSAYNTARTYIKPGLTEIDLYTEVNSKMINTYGFGGSVSGEFHAGKKRTIYPQAPDESPAPTKNVLKVGDAVILDLQTRVDNYSADTARTFFVGKRTEQQERALKVLMATLEGTKALLKPGTKCKDIYSFVSKKILDAGYRGGLLHHAGHGIGLDEWESPFLIPASDEVLEEGMVCAVEPAIYSESLGGLRIEDNYVITKDGPETVSTVPMDLS